MCKNKQNSELELCFEKRELLSWSYAHENQERWCWSHVHEKEKLWTWSSFIFGMAPQLFL